MQRVIVANILVVLAVVAIACSAAIPYTAGQVTRIATHSGR
jgi:type II secretory pathway pseudopilin PulG